MNLKKNLYLWCQWSALKRWVQHGNRRDKNNSSKTLIFITLIYFYPQLKTENTKKKWKNTFKIHVKKSRNWDFLEQKKKKERKEKEKKENIMNNK